MFRVEVHVDPPLTEVKREEHEFVVLEATSSSRVALEWFLKSIEDRTACHFGIEEVT
jgi:hypothetical protein